MTTKTDAFDFLDNMKFYTGAESVAIISLKEGYTMIFSWGNKTIKLDITGDVSGFNDESETRLLENIHVFKKMNGIT